MGTCLYIYTGTHFLIYTLIDSYREKNHIHTGNICVVKRRLPGSIYVYSDELNSWDRICNLFLNAY